MKTLIQCDFDGTITEKDVSFLLLEEFAGNKWKPMLAEYQEGRISVGEFNTRAFAMIKADKQAMLDLIFNSGRVNIRPGFTELLDYCSNQGIKFVIVSNGQDFYVQAILENLGMNHIEFRAATSRFLPAGLEVNYLGPDGGIIKDGFKERYTDLYLNQGYRVVYIGNGVSDIYPARRSHHVFAISDLLEKCRETGLSCIPFRDLHDVVRGLQSLPLA